MSTSQFPTGEAGLVNAQQMMLTFLNQTGQPQTGDGGIVNIQNLLQQVLAGGGGGMVPPGSTGIGAFTTNGTSGPATYSPASGALNIPHYPGPVPAGSGGIGAFTTNGAGPSSYSAGALNVPVYASATLNMQKVLMTSAFSTGATTFATAACIGLGFPFTAQVNPCICLDYNFSITFTTANAIPAVAVIRTTGTIPPSGATVPTGDVLLCQARNVGLNNVAGNIGGTFLDTTLSANTAYNYYVVAWISSGAGTMTINASAITGLCAFEVK